MIFKVFYSGDALSKRARFEIPPLFTPFPQRPGEKDCIFYMRTRTCSFGANCKYDHPAWVPAGGIPDWKEVQSLLSCLLIILFLKALLIRVFTCSSIDSTCF